MCEWKDLYDDDYSNDRDGWQVVEVTHRGDYPLLPEKEHKADKLYPFDKIEGE